MIKTRKTALANEYATLKHSVWNDENVPAHNNIKKSHYTRAMKLFTVAELEQENARLANKIYSNTIELAK